MPAAEPLNPIRTELDRVTLRGTLMGLRRDRSGYVVPRSAVVILAGVLTLGLLPLVMVERGYWRWSRGEQLKVKSSAGVFALLDPTAAPIVRAADDFAAVREPRSVIYLLVALAALLLAGSVVVCWPGIGSFWQAGVAQFAWMSTLAVGIPSTALVFRIVRHARRLGRVVDLISDWQISRQRRPVRRPTVWRPDAVLSVASLALLVTGLPACAAGLAVAAIWRGYVQAVSPVIRGELADRIEEAAGLAHDRSHEHLPPPAN